MEYQLTKNDYEDINILIIVTTSLWESFTALAHLEAEGKKETKLYQTKLEELRSTMMIESAIYERIGDDSAKIEAILEYFKTNVVETLETDRLETVINGEKSNIVIERIINFLYQAISLEKVLTSILLQEFEDIDGLEEKEKVMSYFKTQIRIAEGTYAFQEQYLEDKFACFLAILNKMIENPIYAKVRQDLIISKYRIIFVCKKLEEAALANNFEISNQVYLGLRMVGQMNAQDEEVIDDFRWNASSAGIYKETSILLENYQDSVLRNHSKRVEALLRLCNLRSYLVLLDDNQIRLMRESFYDNIETPEYLEIHPNNSQIENMIIDTYQQSKYDKTIPISVSLVK